MGNHKQDSTLTEEKRHHHHKHRRHHEKTAEEGLQEEALAPVEEPIAVSRRSEAVGASMRSEPEVTPNPKWYMGMKERQKEFDQYTNAFAGTKETLGYRVDLEHFDNMEVAAQLKKLHLDALFSSIQEYREQMRQDPANEDKKEEGEGFYNTCCEKMRNCEEVYHDLMAAIAERKQTVQKEVKLMKRSSVRARLQALDKDSPMMQLIRRIKAMESGNTPDSFGVKTTKTWKFMDLFPKRGVKVVKFLDGVRGDYERVEGGYKNIKTFLEGVEKGSVENGADTLKDKITDAIKVVKGVADAVRGTVDTIRNYSKMSEDNKWEGLVNLISDGIKTALDAGKYITGLITKVPILGGIIGIIKNAVTFFQKGFEIYQSKKRERELKNARRRLKQKMLKRQGKYALDADLRDMNLYSQVEQGADGQAHMTKAGKQQGRETRGLDGVSGGDNRQIMQSFSGMRKDQENPEAKKAYYKAKAAETQAQYDEMKEAAHRNKNITRTAILDVIKEGIDLVGNIASFIPGVGTMVKAGAAAVNSGISIGKDTGSKTVKWLKNWTNDPRSEGNKAKFRAKYAENIYASLADVSRFVNADGRIEIGDSGLDQVRRVEDAYQFAENLLGGVGANMPTLINSETKEELLDNMSSMFARKG